MGAWIGLCVRGMSGVGWSGVVFFNNNTDSYIYIYTYLYFKQCQTSFLLLSSAVISRPPGDLTALNGATLSLVWSVAVADGDIKW